MPTQTSYTVTLAEDGSITLPDDGQRELGFEPCETLVLRLVDGALRIDSARAIVRRARGMLADIAPGRSMVDELIAERRGEARRKDEVADRAVR